MSELYGDRPKALINTLSKLQDVLGELQDGTVAVQRLRRLAAEQPLSPATVFAMGQVAERYMQRAAKLERRSLEVYGKVRGRRWKQFRRAMERERNTVSWTPRRAVLRPVDAAAPTSGAAAGAGSA